MKMKSKKREKWLANRSRILSRNQLNMAKIPPKELEQETILEVKVYPIQPLPQKLTLWQKIKKLIVVNYK